MHTCIHTYIHTYIFAFTYLCMHDLYVCIIHTRTYIHTWHVQNEILVALVERLQDTSTAVRYGAATAIKVCICMYVCMYVCMCMCDFVYARHKHSSAIRCSYCNQGLYMYACMYVCVCVISYMQDASTAVRYAAAECVWTYVYVCECVCIHAMLQPLLRRCAHVCVLFARVRMHMHVFRHLYVCLYAFSKAFLQFIKACMHAYIHTIS
jgi:hypothetical protein